MLNRETTSYGILDGHYATEAHAEPIETSKMQFIATIYS